VRQKARDSEAREALEHLVESALANALALGQVPEVADADSPHRPGGCVAQAWSVAELLRALAWDLA
jgi:glycogen debranching enzyme